MKIRDEGCETVGGFQNRVPVEEKRKAEEQKTMRTNDNGHNPIRTMRGHNFTTDSTDFGGRPDEVREVLSVTISVIRGFINHKHCSAEIHPRLFD